MAIPQNLSRTRPQIELLRGWLQRHATIARAALLFVLALGLRLYRLDAQSLWLDEGGTWAEITGRTGKGWLALIAELWSKDAGYPLYHVLLKAWVGLAGDSEWALRFPSALAGAAAVAMVYLAGLELERRLLTECAENRGWRMEDGGWRSDAPPSSILHPRCWPVGGLLFATSPFALWYSQDAKVYSLLLLVIALELWALLRALRRPSSRAWLLLASVIVVSLFVHRLALLTAAGAALACTIAWPGGDQRPMIGGGQLGKRLAFAVRYQLALRIGLGLMALALAAVGIVGTVIAVRGESRGAGGHIPAGPLQALWLSFVRFSLDRWPGDVDGYLGLPLAVWLLPCTLLTLWGLALLLRDTLARRSSALAVLCLFVTPLALLALALALMSVPIYEARYATVAFPAWMLVLAYPFTCFARPTTADTKADTEEPPYRGKRLITRMMVLDRVPLGWFSIHSRALFFVLCSLFFFNGAVLFQPAKGLFSGAAVKEQWRDAITYLAKRAHPDDLLILHPYYAEHMWDYYAPRVTPDPLPQPVVFANFKEGYFEDLKLPPQERDDIVRRTYEPAYSAAAQGKKRALLLIAPDHARTVDPPPTPADTYGWVGLRFQYSEKQNTWPCGGAKYNGVEVMCQSYPEAFKTGAIPQPATPLDAIFGGELHLRGYSLDLLGAEARPGGTLPITLYWDAAARPAHDYRMFLHLCGDCAIPPVANDDGLPLDGYGDAGHTTSWRLADPVHDERTVELPRDLAPGRYTLLLGVYPAGDPSAKARLSVQSRAKVLGGTRLVLTEITIS